MWLLPFPWTGTGIGNGQEAAVRESLVYCAVIVDLESRNHALCEDPNDEGNPIRQAWWPRGHAVAGNTEARAAAGDRADQKPRYRDQFWRRVLPERDVPGKATLARYSRDGGGGYRRGRCTRRSRTQP